MPLKIDDPRDAMAIPPIFRLAFRPLFLGGTLFSIIAIAWWSHFWMSPSSWQPHGGPIWWHGHEMLFGFGAAIVVGFLLTAVQTWTGVPSIKGRAVAFLALSWLLGRVVLAFSEGLAAEIVVAVDMLFLLFAAIAMAYPVFKVKQWRNIVFVPILLVMALFNGVSHWAVVTEQPALAQQSLHGVIMLFTLIISILGGRVIPFFTANRTKTSKAEPIMALEVVSIATVVLMLIAALWGFNNIPSALLIPLSAVAAIANAWRFSRWGVQHTKAIPLLWSLHLAYAFIPLGMFVMLLQSLGFINNLSAAMHCFTAGAIGGMILAMTSRVTLGHTGRSLNPPKMIVPAYICVLLGALFRVFLPACFPEYSNLGISIAGVLWVLAFSVYVFYYGPMLLTARVDGRPG